MKTLLIGFTAAVFIAVFIMPLLFDDDAPRSAAVVEQATAKPEADHMTQSACRDFAALMSDANDGIIIDAELRQRLIKINETASLSRDPRVVQASRTALSAVTRDEGAYNSLVTFLKLCVRVMEGG